MNLLTALRSWFPSRAETAAREQRAAAILAGATPITEVHPRTRVRVAGVFRTVTLRPQGGVTAVEAELYDGSGSINLIWLGQQTIRGIEPGRRAVVSGVVMDQDGEYVIYDPHYELLPKPGD